MSDLLQHQQPAFVPCSGPSWQNPFPMYAALRDHDPVHHVAAGDYWVLSRFADVFSAARDTATFSSAEGLTFRYGDMDAAGLGEATPMVMLDPPEHTAFRRQVARTFTPRRVQSLEPVIRRFVATRLERLADGGDIVAEVFKPLPSMVVAHFLGVPAEDRDRFDDWTDAIVAASAEGDVLAAPQAVGELFEYFTDLIERRRRQPGDDTISQLLSDEDDVAAVPAMRILGFAFTMVAGGNDTTTGMLGGSAELLTEHLDQRPTTPAASATPWTSCSASPVPSRAWPARPPATSSCTGPRSPPAARSCCCTRRRTVTPASSATTPRSCASIAGPARS